MDFGWCITMYDQFPIIINHDPFLEHSREFHVASDPFTLLQALYPTTINHH